MTSQLRQAESRTGELRVVELIATGAPLDEVLALIIQMSEDRLEGMLAAVIVLDEAGRRMRTAAALSLPAEFCRLLDGQPIGRQGGPCGAAVYHREPVIVADLQQDPAWANYAEEARRFGLRACWATPMISPDGTLLGAFVMHSRVPRSPTRTELELVEAATHLAAIAIQHDRLQRRLRGSEELFAAAFQSIPIALAISTLEDGRILLVNDYTVRSTGYPVSELVGHTVRELVIWGDPDDRDRAIGILREQGQIEGVEMQTRTKRGEIRDWLVSMRRIEFDSRPCILSAWVDITERKQAERALAIQYGVARALAEASSVPQALHAVLGAVCERMNWPVGAFWVRDAETTFVSQAGSWPADHQISSVEPGAVGWVLARGEWFWSTDALTLFFPVVVATNVVGVMEFRIGAQSPPSGATLDLLAAIGSQVGQYLERHRAHEALAQGEKLRALGQLASGVAHDLNQSLALVAGYSDLARAALRASDVKGAEEALEIVGRAAIDGGEAVKRLLTFGRPRLEGETVRIDIGDLLRDVARLTAPRWRDAAQAEGRPITLTVDAPPGLVIDGWPASLREALTNLVLNASDALPFGGTIRLRGELEDSSAVVEVKDSGDGISAEVQAHLFEPFFTTKGDRGTGLGLAQVLGVVERHGGKIDVRSAPGRGTCVRLRFPVAASNSSVELASTAAPRQQRPGRILVVDDEPILARMAQLILSRGGHDVVPATTAVEALRFLEQKRFDVVISDLSLGPGMNGWELAARVRERWPSTPVVLATGWGATLDNADAQGRGVEAVIAKPYRAPELLSIVSRCVM